MTESVAEGAHLPDQLRTSAPRHLPCERGLGETRAAGSAGLQTGAQMRGVLKIALTAVVAASAFAMTAESARAQPAGLDAGKDCHVIRKCNYRRGGAYRGCISAYSCKQCQFVPANCTVDGQRKVCRQLRCGWGAAS